jgi:hypothetical protein
MTDFVLEQNNTIPKDLKLLNNYKNIIKYATFLKQPLKLEMFIPCDEDGNVLEEKMIYSKEEDCVFDSANFDKYQKAKEKVLFEGFKVIGIDEDIIEIELENDNFWLDFYKNSSIIFTDSYFVEFPIKIIEELAFYNFKLTESAIKQFKNL